MGRRAQRESAAPMTKKKMPAKKLGPIDRLDGMEVPFNRSFHPDGKGTSSGQLMDLLQVIQTLLGLSVVGFQLQDLLEIIPRPAELG